MFGAHLSRSTALNDRDISSSEVVQLFISNPRGYAPPSKSNVEELRHLSPTPIYAHLPYLVNPASADPAVREKSRELIIATDEQGEGLLSGIVIHGGQGGPKATMEEAIERWLKTLSRAELKVPLLIENTAGGNSAPGRDVNNLSTLVRALREISLPAGVCYDTCHGFAAGYEDQVEQYDFLEAQLGRVDLLHLNDSRDPLNSARDRHEALGMGSIGWDRLVAVAARAQMRETNLILETPGTPESWRDELKELRRRVYELNKPQK